MLSEAWLSMKKYTPQSIVDKSTCLDEIDKVRRLGIACDWEEYMEGTVGAGVPIKTRNRQIQAAILVVELKQQISQEAALNLGDLFSVVISIVWQEKIEPLFSISPHH